MDDPTTLWMTSPWMTSRYRPHARASRNGSPITLTVAEARALARHLRDSSPDRGELAVRADAKRTAKDQAVGFLRSALADGDIPVTELEARARIAGLLNAGQTISQCRPFRDAKEELGVRSGRSGFGRARDIIGDCLSLRLSMGRAPPWHHEGACTG